MDAGDWREAAEKGWLAARNATAALVLEVTDVRNQNSTQINAGLRSLAHERGGEYVELSKRYSRFAQNRHSQAFYDGFYHEDLADYANTEYEITATCETRNPDPETGNPQAATITFDLGTYNGPVLLALSIWTGGRYMAYETQNIAQPALQRTGQTAQIRVDTTPAQTRFRLDGTRNGLRANLVLGYANCYNNNP